MVGRSSMSTMGDRILLLLFGVLSACGGTAAAPVSVVPPLCMPTIVVATASASSSYEGWPASNLIDGNDRTSWFSEENDSAARGTTPFVKIAFSKAINVSRVKILGNRDPSYPRGYAVRAGKLELLDGAGTVVNTSDVTAGGDWHDFEVRLQAPVTDVRSVRFTSVRDEGAANEYGDVALAEIIVE